MYIFYILKCNPTKSGGRLYRRPKVIFIFNISTDAYSRPVKYISSFCSHYSQGLFQEYVELILG